MTEEARGNEARVAKLAQEFSLRHRRGEEPTIDEYAALHPELSDEIRELFPLLCMLEDLGPGPAEAEPASSHPDLGPPSRLGEYRIIREIGRGGMGVVYEAEQETLRRRVAIKVLPPGTLGEPPQIDRFRIEAQAAARLHHTNIVPVFGVGEQDGLHYYVMQCIRGQTLEHVLREVRKLRAEPSRVVPAAAPPDDFSAASAAKSLFGEEHGLNRVSGEALPTAPDSAGEENRSEAAAARDPSTSIGKDPLAAYFRSAARIALQVAEGLAHAHNEGILHRDIKPSNLLLDMKGTVWITDFGLAKLQGSDVTAAGCLVGTIRYMAPERFQGIGDARSDVYAVGVTLYELLTLRPAFPAGDHAEVLREVTESTPPAPRRLEPSIPRDLETIVLKSMAREPKDRYPTAAAQAEDLRRFLHHEPVSARRAWLAERMWRWCQREPALAALTGVSLLLLIALTVGSLLHATHLDAERTRTKERLLASKLQEGRALRLSREPGSRARSLEALREAVVPERAGQVRNEVIGSLALVELVETARREEQGFQWCMDPEVERAVLLGQDGSITVHGGPATSRVISRLPPDGRRLNCLMISPGGKRLAACCENAAWIIWDVDRAARLLECKARAEPPTASFSTSGERFAHLDHDDTVVIRELPSGGVVRRLEGVTTARWIVFGPGERRLAAAGCGPNENAVHVYDLSSGNLERRLYHPHVAWGVAWHPDGKRVAVGCADFNVYLWDVDSGQRLFQLGGHFGEVTRVFFGDGGRLLASSGWDNRVLLWHSDTGRLLSEAPGELLGFTASDRRLGFSWRDLHGGTGEWRVQGGDACRIIHAPLAGKGPRDIAVSPDGRWLAAACQEQGLRVWALERPDEARRVDAGTVSSVCFEPDGSALWTASRDGLYRWPLKTGERPTAWTLGPPVKIVSGGVRSLSLTADGRRIASAVTGKLLVRDVEAPGAVLRSFSHQASSRCEISPSGRWLVSSTFHGDDVRVWNIGSGALEKSIDCGTARAGFSPDERWLAVASNSDVVVLETGTWREHFRTHRGSAGTGRLIAFSADSRCLAVSHVPSVIDLLRVSDGSELARIEAPPHPGEIFELCFSPDQRLLLAAMSHTVQVWDLRNIRIELAAMGLDWSPGEALPPPPPDEPLALEVDSGGLRAGQDAELERRAKASKILDIKSQDVLLDPTPETFADRAALLERQGDLGAALSDLDMALRSAPDRLEILLKRASIHARLAHAVEAARDCERALTLCCGGAVDGDGHGRTCPTAREVLVIRARSETALGAGRIDAALELWRQVLDLEPENREARERLPWLWVLSRSTVPASAANDPDLGALALECAEKNLRARSNHSAFLRDLGAIQYHLGRLPEAKALLDRAWKTNGTLRSAAFYLSMVLHGEGASGEARKLFEAASAERDGLTARADPERAALERVRSFAAATLDAR